MSARQTGKAMALLGLVTGLFASPAAAQLVWSRQPSSPAPSARAMFGMATHPTQGVPMIFGGSSAPGVELNDTWKFSNSGWERLLSASNPSSRENHAMANGPGSAVIMFGGDARSSSAGASASYLGDTWEFTASLGWRRVANSGPAARAFHAMAYDDTSRAVVMFGGAQGWLQRPLGDTWVWADARWNVLRTTGGPSARFGHAMAFDEARRSIILFGGATSATNLLDDTWEFRDSTWRNVSSATRPLGRYNHRMAYDPRRQRVVLMGGLSARGLVADTWDWDGVKWVHQSTAGPASRNVHGLATDRVRQTVVLFGGGGNGTRSNDTWKLSSTFPHRVTQIGSGCTRGTPPPVIEAVGVPLAGSPDFAIRVSGAMPGARVFIGMSHSGANRSEFPCVSYLEVPVAFFGLVADQSGQASVRAPIPWLLRGASIHCQGRVASPNGASLGFDYTRGLIAVVGD